METAEAIQARIAEARSQLEQRRVRDRAKDEEVQAAEQRQLLRRELDDLENSIAEMDDRIAGKAAYINGVDHDLSGPHLEGMDETRETQSKSDMTTPRSTRDRANCNDTVVSGEMEWAIEGMSWLKSAVQQTRAGRASGNVFNVGPERFDLFYHPERRGLHTRGDTHWKSSLSVRHYSPGPITFRHTFYIKRDDGDFVQWGETGEECHCDVDTEDWEFGPDVARDVDAVAPATGIFGLDHGALLRSEWVQDEVLTIKVKLEVRTQSGFRRGATTSASAPAIVVPPSTLGADLLARAQLDGASDGDVTFVVASERIRAHSCGSARPPRGGAHALLRRLRGAGAAGGGCSSRPPRARRPPSTSLARAAAPRHTRAGLCFARARRSSRASSPARCARR